MLVMVVGDVGVSRWLCGLCWLGIVVVVLSLSPAHPPSCPPSRAPSLTHEEDQC